MIRSRVNGAWRPPKKIYAKQAGIWSKAKSVYARNAGVWVLRYKWGEWYNSYAFTYLKGTSVNVTVIPTWTIPANTYVEIYAGESLASLVPIVPSVPNAIVFSNSNTGTANLFVKVELYSVDGVTFPVVSSLNILIQQESSLFTVATQVLEDALSKTGTSYHVDQQLQAIAIPFSWFAPLSHRAALTKIAEACGGAAFQDRQGNVVIESALGESNGTIVDTIGQDRILDAATPVSNVINSVQLTTKPYVISANQLVWKLTGDNIINSAETRVFEVFFSDFAAVVDPVPSISSSPAGATITGQVWYTWGGRVTVLGSANNQVLTLTVNGKPLVVSGSRIIEEQDAASIRRNGLRSIAIGDNQLVQDPIIAERIAEGILASTAQERRDIETQWRGDPTLELGDRVTIDGQDGNIVEQQFKYNGALSSSIKVRRRNG
ncbi:MAG: hypothetical protein C0436_00085 [Alphaproteobacteria bacterium]|nr:hypothetical protein [Alphaproteobacteria bacterium]